MTDPRDDCGHADPWGEFEPDQLFAGDALYAGDHETIQDIYLLGEVILAFEYWADDFRYWDRCEGKTPASKWEEDSLFSETASIEMAMALDEEEL